MKSKITQIKAEMKEKKELKMKKKNQDKFLLDLHNAQEQRKHELIQYDKSEKDDGDAFDEDDFVVANREDEDDSDEE